MDRRRWPAWHPGAVLRSSDLLGLEDFLLERASFVDPSHGVDLLHWSDWVRVTPNPPRLKIRLLQVRGLTPLGEPIIVRLDSPIECELDEAGEQTISFDLWVSVNKEGAIGQPPEQRPLKLTLEAERAPTAGGPVSLRDHQLYLGRYEYQNDGAQPVLRLILRPAVRRHIGLGPLGPDWQQWTEPLNHKLQTIAGVLGQLSLEGGAAVAAASEAFWLCAAWPYLPMEHLSFRLRCLDSLARIGPGQPVYPITDPSSFVNGAVSDDWPRQLASLLPELAAPPPRVRGAVSPGSIMASEPPRSRLLKEGADYDVKRLGPEVLELTFRCRIESGALIARVTGVDLRETLRGSNHARNYEGMAKRQAVDGVDGACYTFRDIPTLSPGDFLRLATLHEGVRLEVMLPA